MYDKIEGGGPVWEQQPVVGLRPIGYLDSCFLEKNGTPRQGNVARTSRASLDLLFGSNPAHCLDGLTEFSHVWLLWLFHDNGNKRLAPLVHPPRLDGGKKGIYATRTPHRPNPVGLSLCKLEGVTGKPETRNPKPETRNPKPETLIWRGCQVVRFS
jgi:tRNA-Thr(GGU) m(6)t(6)A37 methyltransferase TsaA